jgi:hypothetical protein
MTKVTRRRGHRKVDCNPRGKPLTELEEESWWQGSQQEAASAGNLWSKQGIEHGHLLHKANHGEGSRRTKAQETRVPAYNCQQAVDKGASVRSPGSSVPHERALLE